MFRKIFKKIRSYIFYKKHGFSYSQFRDMVYFQKCFEDLERSGLSFNDYLKKEFANANTKI